MFFPVMFYYFYMSNTYNSTVVNYINDSTFTIAYVITVIQ